MKQLKKGHQQIKSSVTYTMSLAGFLASSPWVHHSNSETCYQKLIAGRKVLITG